MTASEILDRLYQGSTDYKHRHNTKLIRVLHIEESKWALVWYSGRSYSCNGPCYVSGGINLVNLSNLRTSSGFVIWDTARDKNGTFRKSYLPWLIDTARQQCPDQQTIRLLVNHRYPPTQ